MKVAVVGSAAHCVQAPFGDPSWEIWGCNGAGLPKWDRWFELHDMAVVQSQPGHWDWIKAQTKPVYMQYNHDEAPATVTFPLEAMTQKYGTWFFTSTISFMLALAIEEGASEIALYGVDLAANEEYAHQKPGCRFFIQTALLKGIRVTGPAEAEVFVPGKVYGYGKPHPLAHKVAARAAELRGRQGEIASLKDRLTLTLASLKGALDITVSREQLPEMIAAAQAQLTQADRDMLMYEGAIQDQDHIRNNWLGDV
jgi:hypothetical protein